MSWTSGHRHGYSVAGSSSCMQYITNLYTTSASPGKDREAFKDVVFRSAEEVASGILPTIDDATRPDDGPMFHTVEGGISPW